MKKQKLIITILSFALCLLCAWTGATLKTVAADTANTITVADMLANKDRLLPAFNHGGAERLAVSDGVISCWEDGAFFYGEEVDSVAFDIAFSAGTDICFALRSNGGGQMWTSGGYYVFISGTAAEIYKVTDPSHWQTVETQLGKMTIANIFDGSAHSVEYAVAESGNALSVTFSVDGTKGTFSDNGTPIPKANTEFKIARVNTPALYKVSATKTGTEDPTPVNPTKGIALTEADMLANENKLLPAFNYGGSERLTVANNQIASWVDGNFYYADQADSASFRFIASKDSGQTMLFVGLHLEQSNVPWASTGYYAFIQNTTASVYKIDGTQSAWTDGILGATETIGNIFDGKAHEIYFGVDGSTLTFIVDGITIERTFSGNALPVENTEFGMSANGGYVYYVGSPLAEEVAFTGTYTNLESLIETGALRADYNYDGDFLLTKENGFVLSNQEKLSINASITAIDFDIVVLDGNDMSITIRATAGGALWNGSKGYSVYLSEGTAKLYDASEGWADSPVKTATVTNIFDGERHNIKFYAFDDENGYVQVGFMIDNGEPLRFVDTTNVTTLEGHTEFKFNNVNATLSFKLTAPTGTEHAYGEATVVNPTCTESGYTSSVCTVCGKQNITNEVEVLGHDHRPTVTEPTCLNGGYTTYQCSRCSDHYTADETPATGHHYQDTTVDPTCTEKGYTKHVCKCGDEYIDTYVDALGHDHHATVTDPTCTESGYTTYECSRCSDRYTEDETPAIGHDFVEVSREEATTEKTGKIVYECSHCHEKKEDVIPVKTPENKGCGSVVGISGLWIAPTLIGCALFLKKKKGSKR